MRVPSPTLHVLSGLAAAAVLAPGRDAAALDLPATGITYRIEASLDPATRALKGTEEIRWTNRTGEPVAKLPLHLYLNAFSHQHTTWMRGVPASRLQMGDLLAREPDPWGHTEPTSIRQRTSTGERDASFVPVQPDDGNPLDRSLAEITLPEPAAPGAEVVLTLTFEARLPAPIARTGGARDFFLVAQWYPKIGVIEPAGVRHAPATRSAARQFHGPTEFYADFADYDVTFAVPEGWLAGATGRAEGEPVKDGSGLVKVRYTQRAVHDFALVAGKSLVDRSARHTPQGGGPAIDVRYIVPAGTEHQIPRWQRAIEGGLDVLGSRIGPYPYSTLTVVMMPWWAIRTAGMEYPTFITGVPGDPLWDSPLLASALVADGVLVHELGHQYFYGLLASNEQEEAFLDEGSNSYWEQEIMRSVYGEGASEGTLFGRPLHARDLQMLTLAGAAASIVEPIRKRPTWLFAQNTWGAQSYPRSTSIWSTAAALFGQDKVDRVFAEYFRRFAFRHPDADDLLAVAAEAGSPELAAFLKEAFERERIPDLAVTEVSSKRWEAPLGRVVTAEGPVVVTAESRAKTPEIGLPAEAREADGRIQAEITDPGWVRSGQSMTGSITRVPLTPDRGAASPEHRAGDFHESVVRITGPGWDTLPVTVEVRFADGAVVRDRWDGKAVWRTYRFLRGAPVTSARVDPEGHLFVDAKPENNALAASPHGGVAADWGLWLGAAAEWLGGGLSLWL